MDKNKDQKRFVLVHGICHGAWCWYKVKTQLEAAGHSVTAVDLAASGVNTTRVEDIHTLKDYCKPLLEYLSSLGSGEDDKVILVAHSMGGVSASYAADIYPSKIAAIVFTASFMPDTTNPPGFFFEKLITSGPQENWLDTVITKHDGRPQEFALFGPKFMAKCLYTLSPVHDLELAKTLVRVNPFTTTDLTGTKSLSEEGYGSVTRIYIVCGEDVGVPREFQLEMIKNFPPNEVMEIKDADHMAMFSKPQELSALLLEIADKYA
ncbi:hypothetical protein CARUB_v10023863mg [Capsella rubella]|uniref:AB hydrolase-1 domain-containing protein n=1 Tax=Capsella rubella TaxID=81985 RepID=R0HDT7_9BRAS|nr:methylesterase 7 [Capsella rubella]EOA27709.1 hypothetical protein CARUB_v10023863mg [Capsella rubella]